MIKSTDRSLLFVLSCHLKLVLNWKKNSFVNGKRIAFVKRKGNYFRHFGRHISCLFGSFPNRFCAFSWYKIIRRRQNLFAYPFSYVRSSDFSFRLSFGLTMLCSCVCFCSCFAMFVSWLAFLTFFTYCTNSSWSLPADTHTSQTDTRIYAQPSNETKQNYLQCKFCSTTHLHTVRSRQKCLFNHWNQIKEKKKWQTFQFYL